MPDLEDVVEALVRNAGHVRVSWPPEDSVLVEEWQDEWENSKPPVVQPKTATKKTGGSQ